MGSRISLTPPVRMLKTAPGTELAEIVTVAAWPIPYTFVVNLISLKLLLVWLCSQLKNWSTRYRTTSACNNYR
jgi:hypothetical protein